MTKAHPLTTLLKKPRLVAVGLMSGTSFDGVDAALVEVDVSSADLKVRLLEFVERSYPEPFRGQLQSLLTAGVRELCQGNFDLGETFARAALDVIQAAGMKPSEVDVVGSHGQTLWHQPPSAGGVPSTLQVGEPAVIASRTGIVTVGDFRVADVAEGGEGAPLVPYVDWLLFRRAGQVRALQNIGGIANVTVVGDRLEEVIAFDTGPGNMMIDAMAQIASGGREEMDRDGALSAAGHVQDDILGSLLQDDYLTHTPPKSTGRERYGKQAVQVLRGRYGERRPEDLVATLVAFTAESIARSYRDFILPKTRVDEVLVSGGGLHNPTLMRALIQRLAPVPVRQLDHGGVVPDAKEAVAFAVLAVQAVRGQPTNVLRATGARRPAVLGKICLPPL